MVTWLPTYSHTGYSSQMGFVWYIALPLSVNITQPMIWIVAKIELTFSNKCVNVTSFGLAFFFFECSLYSLYTICRLFLQEVFVLSSKLAKGWEQLCLLVKIKKKHFLLYSKNATSQTCLFLWYYKIESLGRKIELVSGKSLQTLRLDMRVYLTWTRCYDVFYCPGIANVRLVTLTFIGSIDRDIIWGKWMLYLLHFVFKMSLKCEIIRFI